MNYFEKNCTKFPYPPPPLFYGAGEALLVHQCNLGLTWEEDFLGTTEYFLIIFVHGYLSVLNEAGYHFQSCKKGLLTEEDLTERLYLCANVI